MPNSAAIRSFWNFSAEGQIGTAELAEDFGVSEVTIRSDLKILDAQKQLVKTHGGAMAVPLESRPRRRSMNGCGAISTPSATSLRRRRG